MIIGIGLVLLVVAVGLRAATANHHIRGRLTASALAFGFFALAAAAGQYGSVSAPLRQQLTSTVEPLLLVFGIINLIVALAINPWRADRLPDRFPKIVQDAIVIGLFAVGATLVLQERIFATTAVGAVVLGFALQDTLGNLFAGLAIQIEKPFRVGHWVNIADKDGLVSEITWRATKIRTKSGNFVVVPNSVLARDTITNYSEPTSETRIDLEVGASYDTPPNEVKATILQAIQHEPLISSTRPPEVLVADFAASAVTYRVRVWTNDFAADERIRDRIRSAIYYAFRRERIEIPYPIQVEIPRHEHSSAPPADADQESVLRGVEIFAALDDDAHAEIARTTRRSLYAAGEALVRQGEAGSSMFVVVRGEAVVTLDPGAREVARLGPGAFFGEMSLLTGAVRTATVAAARDSEVLEITLDAFRRVVLANPAAVEHIGLAVAARAAELEQHRSTGAPAAIAEPAQNLVTRIRRFLHLNPTT
jgi:small-conductance mechanosensitive channel/CRP-like cAMP-binding protein